MKKILRRLFFLLCMALPLAVQAGELREIVLNDGSVIVGELASLSNGIYTINTAAAGTLQIEEAKVETIRNMAGGPAVQAKASGRQKILAVQQEMIADGSTLQLILSLQNDPDFQAVLEDESIMQAITNGDFDALLTNPKIVKLMEKPSVQAIGRKLE